jgi:4a-hydroxytetrahydrobiopterin dehydratase
MQTLDSSAVDKMLKELPKWQKDGGGISRTLTFPTFLEAINMVEKIAELAERENHHPDMDIRYNKLKVALITHDADGLTENDMKMAAILDHLLP